MICPYLTILGERDLDGGSFKIYICDSQYGDWHTVAQLVEALRYKPEGLAVDSRCRHLLNTSGHIMSLGSN
jgi:hypothetical protein